jgi:hypothetical protein
MKKQTDFPLTLRGNRARTDAKIKDLETTMRGEAQFNFEALKSAYTDDLQNLSSRICKITDRLRLVYILTGIAFGAAVIFSIILLGAYFNVGSGGQITILFP